MSSFRGLISSIANAAYATAAAPALPLRDSPTKPRTNSEPAPTGISRASSPQSPRTVLPRKHGLCRRAPAAHSGARNRNAERGPLLPALFHLPSVRPEPLQIRKYARAKPLYLFLMSEVMLPTPLR